MLKIGYCWIILIIRVIILRLTPLKRILNNFCWVELWMMTRSRWLVQGVLYVRLNRPVRWPNSDFGSKPKDHTQTMCTLSIKLANRRILIQYHDAIELTRQLFFFHWQKRVRSMLHDNFQQTNWHDRLLQRGNTIIKKAGEEMNLKCST